VLTFTTKITQNLPTSKQL